MSQASPMSEIILRVITMHCFAFHLSFNFAHIKLLLCNYRNTSINQCHGDVVQKARKSAHGGGGGGGWIKQMQNL